MVIFRYIAKDSIGRNINDVAEAADRQTLVESLRKKGLTIIMVKEEKAKPSALSGVGQRVKSEDIVIFARQLATMVESGVPLVQGLEILSEQIEKKSFREVVGKMKTDVETGSSLSDAFGKHPRVFSNFFISMVRAGESSGMLDEILDRVAAYLEKSEALRRKVRAALIYPAVITVMAIAITLILLIKVIPVFAGIYEGFGAELPGPTLLLMSISDFLRRWFLLVAILLAGGAVMARGYLRTEAGRLQFDRAILKMPVFGSLIRKSAISRFSRTFSTLVKSGVQILSALEIVGKTAGNKIVERAVERVRTNVQEGEDITAPLAASGVFPPMVTRMISIGEHTGELEKMLSKIADFYDDQVETAVTGLTSMIEPLIIAFLGVVIGTVVICMFLPIFQMGTVVQM